jgi:rhomboid protease GluP
MIGQKQGKTASSRNPLRRIEDWLFPSEGSQQIEKRTDRETKVRPPKLWPIVTLGLVAIDVIIFSLEESRGGSENISTLIQMGAIYKSSIGMQYYRIFTAIFLHIGANHLVSNMYALIIIGWNLERIYGHVRFLTVYIGSGLLGSLVSAFTIPQGIVAAGASGAILGCLAALILLQSRFSHVSVGIQLGSAVLSLFYNLVSGLAPGSSIDIAAHFGGAIGGVMLSFLISPPASFFQHINAQLRSQSEESRNAGKTLQVVSKHNQLTSTTLRKRTIKVRRETPTLILLAIICVAPLLGLGYFLITPSIPIDQTINGYTTASFIRTSTQYIATTIFGTTTGPCGSGYYYYYATTCVTRVGLYVQVTPVPLANGFTSSYSYTSTINGASTLSPYVFSPLNSIASTVIVIVLSLAVFVFFSRHREQHKPETQTVYTGTKQSMRPKDVGSRELTKSDRSRMMFCRECGAKISRDSVFCEECGFKLT